jgi:opacity protein-like surface antigen
LVNHFESSMKMRLITLLCLLFALPTAYAQEFRIPSVDKSRAGKWDFTFTLDYLPSQTNTGSSDNSEIALDLKNRTGWGFDLGYNLNNHFSLGFDFSWLNPRYTLSAESTAPDAPEDQSISHRADIITGQLKVTWNLLKTRFTPYVDVGGGWTAFDSNISSGDPVCWWNGWNWVCSSSSFGDSNFSYSGTAGLRWEIGRSTLLKLGVHRMIIDTRDKPEIDTLKFEIGTRY